jgi:probable F420-dependent oxidoreductase
MPNKIKFGYLVPTRDAVMRAPDGRADIRRMLDLAVRSEQMGYDSLWIGDSLLARPRFEALTTLAAISALTKKIELGTAVYITPLRHPVPLAHTVGNLDLLSGGRFIFGIGLGPESPPVKAEYAASGADFHKRGKLQEEAIQIMKALWTGQKTTFQGANYQIENVTLHPLPGRQGGPPILMAAAADRALRRLAQYADGWLPIVPTAEEYAKDWARIEHHCAEFGRDPKSLQSVHYLTLNVNPSEAEAAHEMEEFLLAYYGQLHHIIKKTQAICAGTPERVAEFIRGFVKAGAPHFVVRLATANQEPQMERFLSSVVPLLL